MLVRSVRTAPFVMVLFALATGGRAADRAPGPVLPGVKVPTAWVGAHLSQIALVDVRGEPAYRRGHLAGAVRMQWQDYSDPRAHHPGNLDPDRGRIVRALEAMGIGTDRPVVIYSDPPVNWGEEGRAFWMLELLGHPAVAVMDGGFPIWVAEGRPITSSASTPARAHFVLSEHSQCVISTAELARRLHDPKLRIVDSRTAAEYAGATPYGESRGGHVPGAVSLPWSDCLADDGRLKDPAALRAMLFARGIVPTGEQALYCTGGVRSGFMYWVLRSLGYPTARNDDGSFWEWADETNLPVER